ncbi:hypothetical protein BD560DRAFT_394622 [Blakeslea trispora]|nr:hypothetical protein BD560DRAFT_394622 [Blakeslea trispora]
MNHQIPNEIWKQIFKHIKSKDIRTCSLVCKLWRIILNNHLHVHCNSSDLRSLLNDLKQFPTLGPAISHLSLHGSKDLLTEAAWLEPVLGYCSNISLIQLENNNASAYLPFMTQLDHIQQIQVVNLDRCSPITQCLYLELNYRFRERLTHLELANLDLHDALFHFPRLLSFLTDFPALKVFKASTSAKTNLPILPIHLADLLIQNPCLTSLSLSGPGLVLKTDLTLSSSVCLTELELKQMHIGTDGLKWITHQLKNLKTLSIHRSMILSSPWIGQHEEEDVLQQFLTYLISTRHHYDLIHFRDWTYWIGIEDKQFVSPVYKGRFVPSLLYENMDPEDPIFLADRIRIL